MRAYLCIKCYLIYIPTSLIEKDNEEKQVFLEAKDTGACSHILIAYLRVATKER